MNRYKLSELYTSTQFGDLVNSKVDSTMAFGLTTQLSEVKSFISKVVYGYFYDEVVSYWGEDESEVKQVFEDRFFYDVNVKIGYWYRKYEQVKKLLTDADLSMMQTSKVSSSSSDTTNSAGGSLQKTATTPTGVSSGTSTDTISIDLEDGEIDTTGFVDKYTNAQQKYANASKISGERSGEILREGSIKELVDVLEKLPASFADEISRALAKHFMFVYIP